MKIQGSHFQSNSYNISVNLSTMFDPCWFRKDLNNMYHKNESPALVFQKAFRKTCLAQLELYPTNTFFSMVRLDVIMLLLGLTKAHYKLSDSIIKPSPDVDRLRCCVQTVGSNKNIFSIYRHGKIYIHSQNIDNCIQLFLLKELSFQMHLLPNFHKVVWRYVGQPRLI